MTDEKIINHKILHWSYRDYLVFPEELLDYRDIIEEIYLKENFIQIIPLWLFELDNLTFLHLAGNEIEVIPNEINLLINLEFLDVSCNKIVALPNSIGALEKIERLNIGENRIIFIPEGMNKKFKSHLIKVFLFCFIYRNRKIKKFRNLLRI